MPYRRRRVTDSYRQTLHDGIDRARYVERCAVKNCGPPWMRIASIIRLCSYLICTHRECYSTVNTLEVFARFSHHAIRPKERHHVRYVKRTSYLSLQSSSLQPPWSDLKSVAGCAMRAALQFTAASIDASMNQLQTLLYRTYFLGLHDVNYIRKQIDYRIYILFIFFISRTWFFVYDFTKGFGWGAYELEIWMWWVFARA